MLPASAWALLAFFLRSARPARRRVRGAVVARGRDSAPADHLRVQNSTHTIIYCSIWRAWLLPAGAWLNGLTRLSEIERSQVRDSVDL
jgi:hypothetical protein